MRPRVKFSGINDPKSAKVLSSMIDESRRKLRQGPEDEEKAAFIHEAEAKEAKFLAQGLDRV